MNNENQENPILPNELRYQLHETYRDMDNRCSVVKSSILNDAGTHPIYMPTLPADTAQFEARQLAIESITQLFISDTTPPRAGLLCASADTVAAIEELNHAKLSFKQCVLDIRKFCKFITPTELSKEIGRQTDSSHRCEMLNHAMRDAQISALDLTRCYVQVKVLEPNLKSISWTWATQHKRIQSISYEKALELAEESELAETRDLVIKILEKHKNFAPFARKQILPNQLRANCLYQDPESNETKRPMISISGIVIMPSATLPKLFWRDNPGKPARYPRDSVIDSEPFIKALDLYLYVQ